MEHLRFLPVQIIMTSALSVPELPCVPWPTEISEALSLSLHRTNVYGRALRMPHSRDDQSPEPVECSDSDIEEEEEVKEEEEEEQGAEAEEEEEAAEAEENMEDEVEGRVEVDMDISDSPIRAHDHHNGQRTSVDLHDDGNSHLCNSQIKDAKAASLCRVGREEMADAIPIRDHLGKEVRGVVNPEDEMKQVDMQQRNDDRKQMDSRSGAFEIGTTVTSPAVETSDRNKHPAIVCDFHAKGWCIRGSSCKFFHVKDNPNSSQPQPEGDVANSTREVQLDEGPQDITERSRSPGFRDPLVSSSGNDFAFSSHLTSEKIRFLEHIGRQHQFHEKRKFPTVVGEESNVGGATDAKKLHSSKDDPGFLSSLKDIERDDQTQNWPADKDKSIFMSCLQPEPGFFSNGSVSPLGKYFIGKNSHMSGMGEPDGIWSQHVHRVHSSPLVNLALNSSSRNLSTTGLFPTSRISSWTGFSFPSSSSNLNASPHDTLKLFDRSRDYRSCTRLPPLLKSSSPFSSSELKSFPVTSVSLRSAEFKTKISSNDWEPSVPFQPSFILPCAFLSSSGRQYDPLRDSIELPKLANISGETSFYPEGATVVNKLHQKIHGGSAGWTTRPACDGDTNSMSSHNTYHEKVLDNSCYIRDHNSPGTEAETVGTSAVCQKGTMTGEENPLGPSHLKGSTKQNKASTAYGDSRHEGDSSGHQEDIKVDRFRDKNEVDGEYLTDGDVQQESKAVRNFRAALVDLVKELLKPKWREGSLSKDAHNMIVKRAVEKIISALQPHQIPPTIETVMQYLSVCRPKISKLVEGYVVKYGKS